MHHNYLQLGYWLTNHIYTGAQCNFLNRAAGISLKPFLQSEDFWFSYKTKMTSVVNICLRYFHILLYGMKYICK